MASKARRAEVANTPRRSPRDDRTAAQGALARLHQAAKYPPCWRCSPTLLEQGAAPPPDGEGHAPLEAAELPLFQAQCALVLAVVHQGEGWSDHWSVGKADYARMKSEMFCKIDGSAQKDGNISCEDFEAYCENHMDEILQGPSLFHGMLHESSRRKAFETFDGDGHAGLSREEFDDFVCSLEDQHLSYLIRRSHNQFRAFWGRRAVARGGKGAQEKHHERGLETVRDVVDASALQEADGSVRPMRRLFLGRDGDIALAKSSGCLGIFAPGWWEDLKYYSANNHPIHGIFMCDVEHALDWRERLMMELSTLCYTWWCLHEAKQIEVMAEMISYGPKGKALFSTLFATIPGMVWWHSLFMLFTVPCADIDESAESASRVAKMKTIRQCCEAVGHMLVLSAVLMLLWSLWDHSEYSVVPVFAGRLKGYAVSWCLMLLLYFNPFVAFGNSDPAAKRSLIDKLADIIGIGQWRIEKLRFQYLCIRGLGDLEESRSEQNIRGPLFSSRGCFSCGLNM